MNIVKDEEFLIKLEKSIGDKMDEIEAKMVANNDLLVFPLVHRFTDGLYSRQVELKQGTLVTSKTHKVQHQFFLLSGSVLVWNNDGEAILLQAPYVGITEVNTRRLVYCMEDCVWVTCHPNATNEILEDIEKIVFEDYDNKFLTEEMKYKIKESQKLSNSESITIDNIPNQLI
jgi:quercetin dioxygenase-like cupin family protein